MEQQVRDVVEQFAAPLRGRTDNFDLVSAFTSPIPNTVIGRITGIPPYPGDEERFCNLAQDVIRRFVWFANAEAAWPRHDTWKAFRDSALDALRTLTVANLVTELLRKKKAGVA